MPSLSLKLFCISSVPFDGSIKLGQPVVLIYCGRAGPRASNMAVPEASVNKNNRRIFGENNVRIAWHVFPVKSEAKPKSMQQRAHHLLGACIRRADQPHDGAALLGRKGIQDVPSDQSDLQARVGL